MSQFSVLIGSFGLLVTVTSSKSCSAATACKASLMDIGSEILKVQKRPSVCKDDPCRSSALQNRRDSVVRCCLVAWKGAVLKRGSKILLFLHFWLLLGSG
jgi:hypothetical protein